MTLAQLKTLVDGAIYLLGDASKVFILDHDWCEYDFDGWQIDEANLTIKLKHYDDVDK